MTDTEQREAARQFFYKWNGRGKEDEDARSYWIDILQEILGVDKVTDRVDFEKSNSPEIVYNGRFTFVLGRYAQVSQKFAMLSGTLQALKAGDAGVVDLSDGIKAVFSPN